MLHTGADHLGKERTAVCCLSSVNAENPGSGATSPSFVEDVLRFLDNVLQDFIDRAPAGMERGRLRRHAASARWAWA